MQFPMATVKKNALYKVFIIIHKIIKLDTSMNTKDNTNFYKEYKIFIIAFVLEMSP
jgi:hypothetical protein